MNESFSTTAKRSLWWERAGAVGLRATGTARGSTREGQQGNVPGGSASCRWWSSLCAQRLGELTWGPTPGSRAAVTRLYFFPKSTLVPLHQLTEPNVGAGGGAAEEEGWGAAMCGELPSGSPLSGRHHTGNPGRRADKGRQGCVCGWDSPQWPALQTHQVAERLGVDHGCPKKMLSWAPKERFLKIAMCLLADSWC